MDPTCRPIGAKWCQKVVPSVALTNAWFCQDDTGVLSVTQKASKGGKLDANILGVNIRAGKSW
jgi:hypothetical protein